MSDRHIEAAKDFGGFTEDVQTDEDIREVLRSVADDDPEAWDIILAKKNLPDSARIVALEERYKLEVKGPL